MPALEAPPEWDAGHFEVLDDQRHKGALETIGDEGRNVRFEGTMIGKGRDISSIITRTLGR